MDKYEFLLVGQGGLIKTHAAVLFGGNKILRSIINALTLGEVLVYLGDNGWELVSYVPATSMSNPTVAFKRKKQE